MATRACPDDQTLAALADGLLSEGERTAVLSHLDTCAACTTQLAALAALLEEPSTAPPEALVARALRPRSTARPLPRLVGMTAAAAAVIIAVMVWPAREAGGPPEIPPAATGNSPVRSGATEGTLQLDVPQDNEQLPPGFEVRWHGPAGAAFYQVQVTTPEGDVLWSAQVDGARQSVVVPASLPTATPSYVWVTAHLAEGRRLTSNVVRIQGRPSD